MRKLSIFTTALLMIFFVFACDDPGEEVQPETGDELSHINYKLKASKVTGYVQVAWKGKGGKTPDGDKLVFASFAAHEAVWRSTNNKDFSPKGFFYFSVFKSDYTPERKIMAKVIDVGFGEGDDKKAWFFAEVVSDTKCESSDHSGCSDSDHTDGGCSDDDSSHDGGCDHDDTGSTDGTTHDSEGGCDHDDTGSTDGTTHDSGGGCDHDDSGSDTGCDHDDTSHDAGSGGKPDDKGGKGKQCRVGQYVVAKMHDMGSPGNDDGITWKWFEKLDGFTIESEPKHLCKKVILKGNLAVHIAKSESNATGH